MIECVFFDLYGTLITFRNREAIQRAAAARHGIELSGAQARRGYAAADAMMARHGEYTKLRGAEREQFFARYEQLVLEGSGRPVSRETALEVWRLVAAERPGFALFDDAVPGLTRLNDLGVTLGLISNIDRGGEELRRELGLGDLVKFAITSQDCGREKPDPGIFRAALERAGCDAARAVHVGDQVATDIKGAEAAGVRAVLLDRSEAFPDYNRHPRLATIEEVAAWVAERRAEG